ncbi:V/A-type H+-transporting ATPase subunit F [Fusobacterium naviforme]|nr:ATP synthase subunit F [Fusobacterium naviforme]PSL11014.1 V/A-type H+-transporting ATPase subunit F [Fusobacterium naviforme]STO28387.1 V-type ATP synthase subunit F [Fusobacterium naviforme]
MKLYLISDSLDSLTGMRLAGVEGCLVHTEAELLEALTRAVNDPSVGIVLLTERFSREYPALVAEFKLNRHLPLFVDIPNRSGTGRSADFITAYVSDAIGLKL